MTKWVPRCKADLEQTQGAGTRIGSALPLQSGKVRVAMMVKLALTKAVNAMATLRLSPGLYRLSDVPFGRVATRHAWEAS